MGELILVGDFSRLVYRGWVEPLFRIWETARENCLWFSWLDVYARAPQNDTPRLREQSPTGQKFVHDPNVMTH